MMEVATKGGVKSSLTIEAVNMMLAMFGEKLFVTKTAGELISGYNDPLMTVAKVFMPGIIKSNRFSLMNGVSFLFFF